MKYLKLFFLYALGCLTVVLATTSCGDDNEIGLLLGQSGGSGTGGTPSKEITERMETPQVLTDGSTVLLSHFTKEGGKDVLCYSVEYDKAKLHSRWVAFRFDGITRQCNVSRSNEPFADDPDLPADLRIGSNLFSYPYQRGHLCASPDRYYSRNANEITFYMSNMSPQLGSFNGGYWITLENLVQNLGRNNTSAETFADTLYVVKGGTVKDGQIKEWITRPNGKKVAVPQYYFMALLKVKNGVYSSIAFWMEHKDYGYDFDHQAPLSDIAGDALSVNELEEKTGINFFPNLTKIKQKEESIEAQCTPSNWEM